ncbi:MAG: cyclase family protein [Ruminococcus sp.]|nr:cyclase family protein [Ruminococcus sp.]
MIIYDISRSIPKTEPYEGDPETVCEYVKSIEKGDEYNLSMFSMSAHTGTHLDAPFHFDDEGKKIDELRLSTFYGKCSVISSDRILTGGDMERILPKCRKRLIIHATGEDGGIESSAAQVIADSGLMLIGIDRQSVGADFDNNRVHRILCSNNVTILENLDLEGIKDGNDYTLCAFPIRLDGFEAAPCRAILFEQEKGF